MSEDRGAATIEHPILPMLGGVPCVERRTSSEQGIWRAPRYWGLLFLRVSKTALTSSRIRWVHDAQLACLLSTPPPESKSGRRILRRRTNVYEGIIFLMTPTSSNISYPTG